MTPGLVPATLLGLAAACGGGGGDAAGPAAKPATFAQVERVFAKYTCAGCHPGSNPSLDLRPGHGYVQLVGVRAVEDPRLARVVAGDPARSFLYLKIAGDPKLGDIPAIGARMPQGAPRMAQADIDVVRDWIAQGAKNARGKTVGPRVAFPGSPGRSPVGAAARSARGDATIRGVVEDQRHRPLGRALVTLLLRSADQPGGEEHYRVAVADARGRFSLPHAPTGQYLLKAYGPRKIYLSRIVALKDGETATVDFGLADRTVTNPIVSRPRVERTPAGLRLSATIAGSALDSNYTLAVNPGTGLVFELHRADGGPGVWSRTIRRRLPGPWLFFAVDHQCNISDFVTVSR